MTKPLYKGADLLQSPYNNFVWSRRYRKIERWITGYTYCQVLGLAFISQLIGLGEGCIATMIHAIYSRSD